MSTELPTQVEYLPSAIERFHGHRKPVEVIWHRDQKEVIEQEITTPMLPIFDTDAEELITAVWQAIVVKHSTTPLTRVNHFFTGTAAATTLANSETETHTFTYPYEYAVVALQGAKAISQVMISNVLKPGSQVDGTQWAVALDVGLNEGLFSFDPNYFSGSEIFDVIMASTEHQ